jgi:hypothetical protein
MSVVVRAPAKINLQLSVGPLRDDGYHELVSVFHAVSLVDVITAQRGEGVQVSMSGEGSESLATDDSNLVVQAIHALAQYAQIDPHVSIHVEKSIPLAGGMAGGSADAAGTLVACDALWGTGLSREELADIGARLGSDVPFALFGANAIGRGRCWVGDSSTGCSLWRTRVCRRRRSIDSATRCVRESRSGRPRCPMRCCMRFARETRTRWPPRFTTTFNRPQYPFAPRYAACSKPVSNTGRWPESSPAADPRVHSCAATARTRSATGMCRTVKRATGPAPGARMVTPTG